ncbi:MAG TPA: hypothetical protein VK568_05745 [Thermodesulfobacteriota bacterium]|nr:hypothetical protein [Thermodesulfobacteriota bacterium]
MKKLLILGFVLTMVLVGAPAFVSAQQWWSRPISTIITITTATLEPSGNTLLIPTYKKYVGDVYALTSGNDILELTLCGFLGPTATEEDVEIDFTSAAPSYLPQIVTDHPNALATPETLILWGFGTYDNVTTKVSGPAWFDSSGTLIENSTGTPKKIVLLGVVKASGGSTVPYAYLFRGNIDSILTQLASAPTCHGRTLP